MLDFCPRQYTVHLYSYFDEACVMSQSPSLNELLTQQPLWRAGRAPLNIARAGEAIDSGWPTLNEALHHGGWPRSGSCELLHSAVGIGELSLVLPALSALSQRQGIAWVSPPFLPYAPGLHQQGLILEQQFLLQAPPAQQLWCTEEALRSGAFAAVLSWSRDDLPHRQLRRLHLAARDGHCWHLHFRPGHCEQQASPAPLRLRLTAETAALGVTVLKQPGGHAGQSLSLPRPTALLHRQRPARQWPVSLPPRRRLALHSTAGQRAEKATSPARASI